jgi:hypothetical protein
MEPRRQKTQTAYPRPAATLTHGVSLPLTLDDEFEVLYTDFGRPSIPPERLIRASLLQILFSVISGCPI